METIKKSLRNPYLIAGLIAFFVVTDLILTGMWFDLSKSDWSGWVQAFGSISALGVAIFVMSRQNSHSARLVAQADTAALKRRANAVFVVIESSHRRITECLDGIRQSATTNEPFDCRTTMESAKHVADEVRARLAAIPVHDLGSTGMADGVISIQEVAKVLGVIPEAWGTNADIERIASFMPDLQKNLDTALATFRKGMLEFGDP